MTIVSLYKLDTNVNDTGPLKAHGSNSGVSFVDGKINLAGDFEASDSDNFTIAAFKSFDAFSLSVYFKIESLNSGNILEFDGVGDSVVRIYTISSTLFVRVGTLSTSDLAFNIDTVVIDTWYNLIITYEALDRFRFYLDNVLSLGSSSSGALDLSSGTFTVGSRNGGILFYDGLIDDINIFDHVVTSQERRELINRTGSTSILINDIDYSPKLLSWVYEETNVFFSGVSEIVLIDINGDVLSAIKRYNQIIIVTGNTLRFTGVIVSIEPTENNSSLIELHIIDYWVFALREPVFRAGVNAFTNKTASQILIDIVDNELAGLNLTTTGVIATTNIIFNDSTETKMNYRGHEAASKIFQNLAFNEDYVVSIDKNKDVIFRSDIAVDSGIHLVYPTNILEEGIKKFGGDLINVVHVRGAPGQPPDIDPVGAIVEDFASISNLATDNWDGRLPIVTISKPELATDSACQSAGEYEIKRRNQDPDRGPILVELNYDVNVNELITLTIPAKNITAQTFMVQKVRHSYNENLTTYDVIYYTRETADLVQLIMEQNRGTELHQVDDGLVFSRFITLNEQIVLTAHVDVESRTFAGAEYGEFNYGDKNYGTVSGAFTSDVSAKQITVQNKLLDNWLRIIGQIATVPPTLQANNSHLAIGNDSTAIMVTDTTLAGENFRLPMQPGYPNRGTDLKLIFKSILGDSDAIVTTIRNLALFDASASGNMLLAGVLASDLSKVADQEWDFTVTLTQASLTGFLTTAGANLLRDLLASDSLAFLDNSNANIEIITTPVDRNAMNSGFPKFSTVGSDTLRYEVTIDTTALDGKTFTGVDLYNLAAAGIQVIDGALGVTITIVDGQTMKVQILIKLRR